MQDIYIDKVRLENVRNHDEMEMDFPPNNFTVIIGKNGAGKSTIFKSISMALYGDDGGKKGERLSVIDMLNERSPRNLAIIVDFRIVENDNTDVYQVQLYQNHKKFKNGFYLLKNGTDISGKTKTETYEMISKLLYPRDVYHNTVYFTQQVKDFFTALTNSDQKDIFDSILSSKIYDQYYSAANSVLTARNMVLQQYEDAERTYLAKTEELRNHIAQLGTAIQQGKLDNAKSIEECKSKISAITGAIQLIQKDIEKLQPYVLQHTQDTKLLAELQSKIALIQQTITDEIEKERQSLEKDTSAKLQQQVNEAKVKISTIQTEYDGLRNTNNTKIGEYQQQCAKEVEEVNNKIQSVYQTITKIDNVLRTKIDEINNKIFELKTKYDVTEKTKILESRRIILETAISELVNKVNANAARKIDLQKHIDLVNEEINKDKQGLDAPVAECSKCHQPLRDPNAIASIKSNITQNQVKIQTMQNQIQQIDESITSMQELIKEKCNSRDLELAGLQNEINQLKEKMVSEERVFKDEIEKLKARATSAKNEQFAAINRCNADVKAINLKYDSKIKELQADNQRLSDEETKAKERIKAEFEAAKAQYIQEYNTQKSNIETTVKQKFNDKLVVLKAQLDAVNLREQECNQKLSELEALKTKLGEHQISLNVENNKLKELSSWNSPFVSMLKTSEDELAKIGKKVEENQVEKNKVKREVDILTFWKQGFSDSGIKSMLIDMAIPYMNESVAEYLDIVAPGVFTVSFDTLSANKAGQLRDKFSVNVRHNIKGTSSHKKLSGGEKRLVDIACMCALRGLAEKLYGKRIHNIFYDEVLDALDEDVSYIFCQVSKKMASDRNISMITHKLVDNVEIDRCFKL